MTTILLNLYNLQVAGLRIRATSFVHGIEQNFGINVSVLSKPIIYKPSLLKLLRFTTMCDMIISLRFGTTSYFRTPHKSFAISYGSEKSFKLTTKTLQTSNISYKRHRSLKIWVHKKCYKIFGAQRRTFLPLQKTKT